jgi:hypothetical protein
MTTSPRGMRPAQSHSTRSGSMLLTLISFQPHPMRISFDRVSLTQIVLPPREGRRIV